MKQILLIMFLFCCGYSVLKATETVDVSYHYPHLEFSYTYNDGTYGNGTKLDYYYRGLSTQLEEYIADRIKKGLLKDKKVTVSLWLLCGDICKLQTSQGKTGYYIQGAGELHLEELVRVIDYYSSPKWTSFVCEEPDKNHINCGALDKILKSFEPQPDLTFFRNKSTVVFKLQYLEVRYTADGLTSYIGNKALAVNLNQGDVFTTPRNAANLYFISTTDSIYVYRDDQQINKHKRPDYTGHGFVGMEVYQGWMNYNDEGTLKLSYSYAKNRFYDLPKVYSINIP